MTLTFTTIKERVSCHLNDTGNLIWTENLLETAVHSTLLTISRVHGSTLTLSGLDGATETTLPDEDEHVLVTGAVAYALTFRASGRFEDAHAGGDLPDALASWASTHMTRFQSLLAQVKSRTHQESTEVPYAEWEWEEET